MRVKRIKIEQFRSIENVELIISESAPLVLFGPNNAGKSNILAAIDRLLGERWPLSIEMLDSDFFMRDEARYPYAAITAQFDRIIHRSRYGDSSDSLGVEYWSHAYREEENHFASWNGEILKGVSSSERSHCQSFLIGAERNISSALSYSSRYSLLSQFTHRIHSSIGCDKKDELTTAFDQIKAVFEGLPEYQAFVKTLKDTVDGSVKGFTHSLDIDLSAYDPNNYANALRIVASESGKSRSFDEFGTGEQQILLMAFAKAYLQVFGRSQGLVLIIEEPEAHLHPLAQRWLKKYMYQICHEGVQVIVSTHCADFLDPRNLGGLVRVYKDNGVTKTRQLTASELVKFCVATGVPQDKISIESVNDFYAAKVMPHQLSGMFADKVLLVEGATERLALPVYFERIGYDLSAEGAEIVECNSKKSIPLLWRLYNAFGYNCYCLFDGDANQGDFDKHFVGLFGPRQLNLEADAFTCEEGFAYFGSNWEKHFSTAVIGYDDAIAELCQDICIDTSSKQAKAYAYAIRTQDVPEFVRNLVKML